MKPTAFPWQGPEATASAVREWAIRPWTGKDITGEVSRIGIQVFADGDAALVELTRRLDGVETTPEQMRVDPAAPAAALAALSGQLREAMELAAANIRAVAEAQPAAAPAVVDLPQGQRVTIRELPVEAAGVYAPGGRASYPSTVLMCAIPAQVAGVERVAVVSPPGPDGLPSDLVLAAAGLCGIEEVYALGGAQAVFGLAFGTQSIPSVDVLVGPGNLWVQEAKRRAFGEVGIDSYAGPSELMLVAGPDTDTEWAAADLCAQAEHGEESPLLLVASEQEVLDSIAGRAAALAGERESVVEARLAVVRLPSLDDAVGLANAFAPEHLELMSGAAASLADRVTAAGCVFVGRFGATAFGDYAAGSNHVLPTARSGRFAGPLGPDTFRRKISTVEVSAEAAAKLAPHVDTIARAEGFPVHGESAMIRTR